MGKVLFSIIVPVYNQERFLDECIKSVLEQKFTNYELILVNDGSTDSSALICDKYKSQDDRIKVIHKKNGGATSARKAAAALAVAEYIVALDGDDYMKKDSLSILADIIAKHSPDIISSGFTEFNKADEHTFMPYADEGLYTGDKLEKLKHRILYEQNGPFFTYGFAPSIWCNIMKKDYYLKYQQAVDNRIKLGEDLCVTFPAVLDCHKFYVLKNSLIMYRILTDSTSHRYRPTDIDDLKLLAEHFSNIDLNHYSAENQICVYILSRIYAFLANSARNLNNYKEFKLETSKIDDQILKCLKKIKKNTLPQKARCILLLIKWKCWLIFWLLYNRV